MKDDKTGVTKSTRKGFSRRTMLKGTAAAAGVAVGSGAIKSFPTIWAQNIKDVELRIAGLSVSNMPQVEELAKKELGLNIKMQAIDIPVIIHTAKELDDAERTQLAAQTRGILDKQSLSREIALGRIRDALRHAVDLRREGDG